MLNQPKRICLVMIVKNEAAIIARCLRSVRPFIDYWIICDTGSTDGTKVEVERCLSGIPGEYYEDPWINFEHNRSLSIARAAGKADYHLLLDADMVLVAEEDFRPTLIDDVYLIPFEGQHDYSVERLVSDQHKWVYKGVTHEYVYSPTALTKEKLASVRIIHFEDGGCREDKYARDIELLSEALQRDPNEPRTVFYLAQSYRDIKLYSKALHLYLQRTNMGGWDEEVWYSLYMAARLQEHLGVPWPTCHAAYLQAFQFRPTRLEPIYHIAKFYREHKQYTLGLLFARLCQEIGYPDDCLFIERRVYEELLPEEYKFCCQALGFVGCDAGNRPPQRFGREPAECCGIGATP